MNKNINGVIVVNKEKDFTSHDCVAILRRKLGIKRIGHTGTLDPMATGVLAICIGSAARIMDYTDWDLKKYKCKILFGKSTDTDDIWGNVIESKPVDRAISKEEVSSILDSFLGYFEQTPPIYSAIKVDGKKLYQYAREGKSVDIKKRKVFFDEITLIDIVYEDGFLKEIEIDVSCSKGTYIRSLCRDIGESLGYPATMSYLDRLESGPFKKEISISIDEIKSMSSDSILEYMIPLDLALESIKKIDLDAEEAKSFVNGKKLSLRKLNKKLGLDEMWLDEYIAESYKSSELMKESSGKNYLDKNHLLPVFSDCENKNISYEEQMKDIREFSNKMGYKKNYFRVYFGEEFLGVGKIDKGSFISDKVFNVRIQNENI